MVVKIFKIRVNVLTTAACHLSERRYSEGGPYPGSVRQLTLDFSSSHDLKVVGLSPELGPALSGESA